MKKKYEKSFITSRPGVAQSPQSPSQVAFAVIIIFIDWLVCLTLSRHSRLLTFTLSSSYWYVLWQVRFLPEDVFWQ